jgi:uncharacterized repeat protein (TIGR01451 family)
MRIFKCSLLLALGVALMALFAQSAFAQAPAAGSTIGNRATATYNDAAGQSRTTQSNLVETIVQQVYAVDIEQNRSRTASPGQQVTFPHVVTNNGNGTDTINLLTAQLGGDDFDTIDVFIFEDANQDGQPDNTSNPITSVTLAAGASTGIVIRATVPNGATSGQTSQLTITATSQGDNTKTDFNTDTVTVTQQAVVNVTKSMSATQGLAGSGPYTITLTYTNNGPVAAANLVLTDILNANFVYVANSGRASITGATVLTDANNTDNQGGVIYDYNVTTTNAVTATIVSVPANASATLSFQVTIATTATPGLVPNTATFAYNDGAANIPPQPTNTVNFLVLPVYAVDINDLSPPNNPLTATQGGTVTFPHTITNNGNATDTINVFVDLFANGGDFPAGTSYEIYQADGVTPLTDSNGDGTPDTGPLAPAGTRNIVIKITLPTTVSTVPPGNPFDAIVRVQSVNDPSKTDSTTDSVEAITGAGVDITNNSAFNGTAPAPGQGLGPEAAPVTINGPLDVSAAASTTFHLFINNRGSIADSFQLRVDQTGTNSTIPTVNSLPAGWSVDFFLDANNNGAIDAGESAVTNTGSVPAGGSVSIVARINIPRNFAAGNYELYFYARSDVTGVRDIKRDRVTIAPRYVLTVEPNRNGQVFPGNSVQYGHIITNDGNAPITNIALSLVTPTPGFTSVVYDDANGNGQVDPGELVITTGTFNLNAGQSKNVVVVVQADSGVNAGVVDTTTLTATGTGAAPNDQTDTATDTTTVLDGQVALLKRQALDAACDGTPDGAFVTTQLTTGAVPGACIIYQITASNTGAATVTDLVITDNTPTFTTYRGLTCPAATVTVGTIGAEPTVGSPGSIVANVGTLTSAQQAVLTFCVRINN